MAVVAWASSYLVTYIVRSRANDPELVISGMNNVIRLVFSIIMAVLTYGQLTIRLGIIRENEIKLLPKGEALARFLKKVRLLR